VWHPVEDRVLARDVLTRSLEKSRWWFNSSNGDSQLREWKRKLQTRRQSRVRATLLHWRFCISLSLSLFLSLFRTVRSASYSWPRRIFSPGSRIHADDAAWIFVCDEWEASILCLDTTATLSVSFAWNYTRLTKYHSNCCAGSFTHGARHAALVPCPEDAEH